jgi:diketogulonate reductase-like aldo/keto reductase
MEKVKLNNGLEMPILGYGVFEVSPEECERCVLDAISVGYRSIDTAQAYRNEEGVGNAIIKCGVPRDELFITTKIWISNAGYEKAKSSINESLKKLKNDYIDLLLIHQPYGDYYGTYRAMEEAYKEGKVRAIGVSNFHPDRFVDLALHVNVPPAMNQVETNVFSQQTKLREEMDVFGTKTTAWGPLARGLGDLFMNETLLGIGTEYGKSASQVALRFLIEQGIVVIPKSVHVERMKQNMDVFDFSLSTTEIEKITNLNIADEGTAQLRDPKFIKWIINNYKL